MAALNLQFVEFDAVTSTNDLIKQAIENGSGEGLVVRADSQDGGYGRYGRSWASPAGGLYMSVLLEPKRHIEDAAALATKLPTLSLIASLAVREAILRVIGDQFAANIRIKWPNDVIYIGEDDDTGSANVPMFHKLCGISLEQHQGAICIGIGINVFPPDDADDPDAIPTDPASATPTRNAPAYLATIAPNAPHLSIEALCTQVARELADLYERWFDEPFGAFKEWYDQVLALRGMNVRIEDNRQTVRTEGEVLGVDDHGRLLVRMRDGNVEPVSSGEAHVSLKGE